EQLLDRLVPRIVRARSVELFDDLAALEVGKDLRGIDRRCGGPLEPIYQQPDGGGYVSVQADRIDTAIRLGRDDKAHALIVDGYGDRIVGPLLPGDDLNPGRQVGLPGLQVQFTV